MKLPLTTRITVPVWVATSSSLKAAANGRVRLTIEEIVAGKQHSPHFRQFVTKLSAEANKFSKINHVELNNFTEELSCAVPLPPS
jgi:hypothetical protein